MFGISAYSEAPYSSLASGVRAGVASITGSATVTATSYGQFIYGKGVISGTGNFTALGGFTAEASASITTFSHVTANGIVIWSGDASISATATIVADGHIQGNNWTVMPVTSNTWNRIG